MGESLAGGEQRGQASGGSEDDGEQDLTGTLAAVVGKAKVSFETLLGKTMDVGPGDGRVTVTHSSLREGLRIASHSRKGACVLPAALQLRQKIGDY